jgi:hypothetical protein
MRWVEHFHTLERRRMHTGSGGKARRRETTRKVDGRIIYK